MVPVYYQVALLYLFHTVADDDALSSRSDSTTMEIVDGRIVVAVLNSFNASAQTATCYFVGFGNEYEQPVISKAISHIAPGSAARLHAKEDAFS